MSKISMLIAGAEDPLEFASTSQDQRRFLLAYEKFRSGEGEGTGKFAFRESREGGVIRTLYVDLAKVLWVVTEEESVARPAAGAGGASGKKK